MSENNNSVASNNNMSMIDKAIAAAKARKAAKVANGGHTPATSLNSSAESDDAGNIVNNEHTKRIKLSDEERAAKVAQIAAERAARQAIRETQRVTKSAEREASRQPAHIKKVERAAANLPHLSEQATLLFNEATTNLPAAELSNLAAHIAHFNREKATLLALGTKISAGDVVRITGGDPRFVGKVGTVAKAQRIRCYVDVPGVNRPVYLFTSDVQLHVEEEVTASQAIVDINENVEEVELAQSA